MHVTTPAAPVEAPEVLQLQRRWLRWEEKRTPNGKLTKVPDRSTAANDGDQWYQVDEAGPRNAKSGVGFITTGSIFVPGPQPLWLIALDLDACVHPDGVVEDWASEIVEQFASYTELSPSQRGLRVWAMVDERVTLANSLVLVSAISTAPPKKPQLQVFGHGPAGYVTFTGLKVTPHDVVDASNAWVWLCETYGLRNESLMPAELPKGSGAVPSLEEITALVSRGPQGAALIAGKWQEHYAEASASEAFHALVHLALRCAGNHGNQVVQWLLRCTAWGRGQIDGSMDPGKYAREKWVRKDVARAARTATLPPEQVFTPLPMPEAPTPAKHKGRLAPVSDLWDTVGKDPFLVHGVLPRQGLARFFGDPGCGKTPMALSLAIAVATGAEQWMGHAIDQQGPVIYMVGEDRDGLINRCRAEAMRLGLGREHFKNVLFSLQPGQLLDADDVLRWITEIRELSPQGVPLLVVDTQSRNFGAGDENNTKDMTVFVHHLTAISDQLRCLVLLVHHTGLMAKDRARGNSVALGGLDAELKVEREGSEVRLIGVKEKNWAKPAPLVGVLRAFTVGEDVKGRPITAVTLQPGTRTPEEVFKDAVEAPGFDDVALKLLQAVQAMALEGAVMSRPALAARAGVADGVAMRNRLDELLGSLGLLVEAEDSTPRKRRYQLTDAGRAMLAGQPQGDPVAPADPLKYDEPTLDDVLS